MQVCLQNGTEHNVMNENKQNYDEFEFQCFSF